MTNEAPREVYVLFDDSFNSIEDVYTKERPGVGDDVVPAERVEVRYVLPDLAAPDEGLTRNTREHELQAFIEKIVAIEQAKYAGTLRSSDYHVSPLPRWVSEARALLAAPVKPEKGAPADE